ncbi:MAG: hypothetical protein M5U22_12530 [Thermoleophilia bacterium]|nr:hypothetical protein [Thermoleophilia bacterium]
MIAPTAKSTASTRPSGMVMPAATDPVSASDVIAANYRPASLSSVTRI